MNILISNEEETLTATGKKKDDISQMAKIRKNKTLISKIPLQEQCTQECLNSFHFCREPIRYDSIQFVSFGGSLLLYMNIL